MLGVGILNIEISQCECSPICIARRALLNSLNDTYLLDGNFKELYLDMQREHSMARNLNSAHLISNARIEGPFDPHQSTELYSGTFHSLSKN